MEQAEIYKQIINFWNNDMPFNRLLGLQIQQFDTQQSEVKFLWQDKLIGNPIQKILHGGVTATVLDIAGGVVAAANIIDQLDDLSPENIHYNLRKLSTIDLRTDFLRPGKGEEFSE